MSRKRDGQTPTAAEILSYNNVPTHIAAEYLGCGIASLQDALRQERTPFGYSVCNQEKESWTFHISPGQLVSYQNGTLPAWDMRDMVQLLSNEIEKILDLRSKAAIEILCPGLSAMAQKRP